MRARFSSPISSSSPSSATRRSRQAMTDEQITKLYYSIGEVGGLVELEPHVLRYWESEFRQLSPRKNRAGRRVYTEGDIATVRRIKHLLREERYTIDGARQVLARAATEGEAAPREELKRLRKLLVSLREQLATGDEE